ncbi:hypothetical protein CLAFUW4_10062 [Fulvia fulva]|uniref:Uncharacterized protein n=1 Tax=Passalora fulva TaxID=5499 RepID=A0A9Q8UU78_PASFU|nr:uncharacterized protein CLAFUR5_12183 [Fulvia fulva]KAK4616153.1 hypothetical protein CLAFUR4_10066 [Fulvia fulva]KAK4617024.1 hypothetical protein CLAFUR0_10064 [Fulvia fulva]UJO22646.1 hypothetical protein CLAFUR5_12183 [Fulvia fulva]WPV18852.1 hypothetical protein CLAFUW4_10062 [Fulvia fulva]WPV33666.1 hypothetical protein CLAFUW7_10063 [Fulvia fulva]
MSAVTGSSHGRRADKTDAFRQERPHCQHYDVECPVIPKDEHLDVAVTVDADIPAVIKDEHLLADYGQAQLGSLERSLLVLVQY